MASDIAPPREGTPQTGGRSNGTAPVDVAAPGDLAETTATGPDAVVLRFPDRTGEAAADDQRDAGNGATTGTASPTPTPTGAGGAFLICPRSRDRVALKKPPYLD